MEQRAWRDPGEMLGGATGDLPSWFKAVEQCCPLHGDTGHPANHIWISLGSPLPVRGDISWPPMDAGD